MTTNPATITAGRIADGVTAAFVRDLSRHSARATIERRRASAHAASRSAARVARTRDDCGEQRRETVIAA
jgi:hypothetical protein